MLTAKQINIRDPFVLYENGKYYLYGTRAASFGQKVNGFDVYISDDLTNWINMTAHIICLPPLPNRTDFVAHTP